jgi:hypothetical protein
VDDLTRLVELRRNGTITDAEFATTRARTRAGVDAPRSRLAASSEEGDDT